MDWVQGWPNSPLMPAGSKTALYLGAGLKEIAFDRYFTSDAGRQREALQVILKGDGATKR
jgi:probable phosphoglycerate mutase